MKVIDTNEIELEKIGNLLGFRVTNGTRIFFREHKNHNTLLLTNIGVV